MCLRAYIYMRVWGFSLHRKSKGRTSDGGGGCKILENLGQTGEGGLKISILAGRSL